MVRSTVREIICALKFWIISSYGRLKHGVQFLHKLICMVGSDIQTYLMFVKKLQICYFQITGIWSKFSDYRDLIERSKACRDHLLCRDHSYKPGGGRVVRWCWVNFQCWGVLLIWIIVWQGPTALAVGSGEGCLDIFSLVCRFSFLSPSLWETARY